MLNSNNGNVDRPLGFSIFFLLILGTVMVYSARLPLPSDSDLAFDLYNLGMHPLHVLLGVAAMFIFLQIPVYILEKGSGFFLVFGISLLVIVLFKKLFGGSDILVDGAVRSLNVTRFTFQPAELMKLLIVIFAAGYAVRHKDRISEDIIRGMGPIGLILILIVGLLMYQPDLGSVIIICSSVIIVLFLGGMTMKAIAGVTCFLISGVFLIILFTKFRLNRLLAYLDPCSIEHSQNAGWQLCQALVAFGNGGLFGTGLGLGTAKLGHLPLPHTDFIFSVIGEELGFIGIFIVLVTFAYLIIKSIMIGRVAMAQDKLFAGLLAQGIGASLCIQALIHVGVNTGLLPTKGLTLPFISYGGSSMLIVCISMGILLRIDVENKFSLTKNNGLNGRDW